MRFGFFFWPSTPEYTARMARLGDDYGFDMVGIADTPGNAMDPWVAMTLTVSATSRVRLATCVTNLVSRHPSITASAAASVDLAAGGRTILGIGAGHSGVANVGGAPTRAAELREGLAFLKTALSGAPASWRGAAGAVDVWSIACLDVAERREDALAKLGNILGFVAAYILGPDPEGRGVPAALVPAVRELRATYTTRQREMDPGLTRRLGIFDYLRARLAVAGTPEDCLAQVRAAEAAGVTQLMFTVSLAADPVQTVELFGRAVLPRLARG